VEREKEKKKKEEEGDLERLVVVSSFSVNPHHITAGEDLVRRGSEEGKKREKKKKEKKKEGRERYVPHSADQARIVSVLERDRRSAEGKPEGEERRKGREEKKKKRE